MRAQALGDGVQVEHSLVDLVNGVLGVDGRQLFDREHLVWRLDHALSVVVAQFHAGADDGAAEPLAQDLQGRAGEAEPVRQKSGCKQESAALIGRAVVPVPLV